MHLFGKQAAASTDPIPPPGLTVDAKLNGSVWELYCPDEEPDADIILFHGLQMGERYEEAFWKTWLAKNQEQLVWPKDWLSKRLLNARILSVSYNSSASKVKGETTQGDMVILGGDLVQDIVLDTEHDIGQKCPVFLVGHCLGGIVIKQFISSVISEQQFYERRDDQRANEQWKLDRTATFLENFKGAFFYGTPNGGIPDNVTPFANRSNNASPILKLLRTLDTERGRINEEFRQLRSNMHVSTFGIAEGRETNCAGFRGVVVPEGSARYDVDDYYTHRTADHFEVCQATTMADATVIGKLINFISNAVPTIKSRSAQEAKREAKLLL